MTHFVSNSYSTVHTPGNTTTSTSTSSSAAASLHHLVPHNLQTTESVLTAQVISNEKPDPFSVDSPYLWTAPIALETLIDSIFLQREAILIRDLFKDASNKKLIEDLNRILLEKTNEVKHNQVNFSHKDILYYFHFSFHVFSLPTNCDILQPTFQELFCEMARQLSVEEQGQLVRFASLLGSPFEKNSEDFTDDFRAAIKDSVYKETKRLKPPQYNHWISIEKTLKILCDQIDIYLKDRPEKIREDYELDEYFQVLSSADLSALLLSLKARCDSDLTGLSTGKERQLPKWFVSHPGRVFASTVFNRPLTALKNSQTVTLTTACEGTLALIFPQNVEWNPSNIKKIYRDVKAQLQLECKNIIFYNCNLKNKINNIDLGVAVIENHLINQVQEFSANGLLNDIKILSLLEARLFNALLSQFPLYIPAYLEPADIYPVAAPQRSVSPAQYLPPPQLKRERVSTEEETKKKQKIDPAYTKSLFSLKRVDAGLGKQTFIKEWKDVLSHCLSNTNAQLFGKGFSKDSPYFNEIQQDGIKIPIFENLEKICPVRIDLFFNLIETDPKSVNQAILRGFLGPKSKFFQGTCAIEVRQNQESNREALKKLFNFSDKDFPVTLIRNGWNAPLLGRQATNPKLIYNRKSVQTMLFTHALNAREKILLFDQTGLWEKVRKKDREATSRFFAYVALEIIQVSTIEPDIDSIRCPVFRDSEISTLLDFDSFDREVEGSRVNINEPHQILKAYNCLEERQKELFAYFVLGADLSQIPKDALARFQLLAKLLSEMGNAIRSRYFAPSDVTTQSFSPKPLQNILEFDADSEEDFLKYPELYPADLYSVNLFN